MANFFYEESHWPPRSAAVLSKPLIRREQGAWVMYGPHSPLNVARTQWARPKWFQARDVLSLALLHRRMQRTGTW